MIKELNENYEAKANAKLSSYKLMELIHKGLITIDKEQNIVFFKDNEVVEESRQNFRDISCKFQELIRKNVSEHWKKSVFFKKEDYFKQLDVLEKILTSSYVSLSNNFYKNFKDKSYDKLENKYMECKAICSRLRKDELRLLKFVNYMMLNMYGFYRYNSKKILHKDRYIKEFLNAYKLSQ